MEIFLQIILDDKMQQYSNFRQITSQKVFNLWLGFSGLH